MFRMKTIYITEDHEVIREGVRQYLNLSGFNALGFETIRETEEAIKEQVPDLLILDVMLPDGDGFSFAQRLYRTYRNFHIFFCTAKIEESDRILGFELGCDDYIQKPFSPKELVLRIEALFRRLDGCMEDSRESIDFNRNGDTLTYDRRGHRILVNGEEISITASEWKIISFLIENAQNLVTRTRIMEECFNYHYDSYDRLVDTHVKNIRMKLGAGNWIETVRGYGYKFIGDRK